MQHSVTFYCRRSCQILYSQLALVSWYSPKLRWAYFLFTDFWSIPYNRNCHNCRTRDDIDTKLGPVTKSDRRRKPKSKKLTMTSFWKIVTPLLGAIQKPDSGRIVSKTCIFIKITFYLTKTEDRTKKSLTQFKLFLWVKALFWPKNADFFKKKLLTSAKLRGL